MNLKEKLTDNKYSILTSEHQEVDKNGCSITSYVCRTPLKKKTENGTARKRRRMIDERSIYCALYQIL